MSINPKQLKHEIGSVILEMGKYSDEAVYLLMLTSATESHLGTYLTQLNKGPARGIFQMEEDRDIELINRYILKKPLTGYDKKMVQISKNPKALTLNIEYQIWIARWYYYQFSEAIPKRKSFNSEAGYVCALALYWKKYWNTEKGAGLKVDAVNNYSKYVLTVR